MFIPENQLENVYDNLKYCTYKARYKQTDCEVKKHSFKLKRDPNRKKRDAFFKEAIEKGLTVTQILKIALKEKIVARSAFFSMLAFYEYKYGMAKRGHRERSYRMSHVKKIEHNSREI